MEQDALRLASQAPVVLLTFLKVIAVPAFKQCLLSFLSTAGSGLALSCLWHGLARVV